MRPVQAHQVVSGNLPVRSHGQIGREQLLARLFDQFATVSEEKDPIAAARAVRDDVPGDQGLAGAGRRDQQKATPARRKRELNVLDTVGLEVMQDESAAHRITELVGGGGPFSS
jgi:hypothetical protein